MTSRRRLVVIGLVVLAAFSAVLWLIAPEGPEATPVADAGVTARPGPAAASDAHAPAAPPPPLTAASPDGGRSAQVLLERPASPPPAPAGGPPRAPVPIAESWPRDRREQPGPHAKQELEILHYAFETLDEDIRECLAQWDKLEPGHGEEVMIAFELDANGLQRSWLEHEGEIPFGPRSCLANAVYGLDWSHVVSQPAKVTNRFVRSAPDGGS